MKKQTNATFPMTMHDEMRRAFSMLSGKWKLEIMCLLNQRMYRFGELRKALPGVTQHVLTTQLRELEGDGLISRTVFAEVPPRVEYAITDRASGLGPALQALTVWWTEHGNTLPARPASRGRIPGKPGTIERT